jgi:dihydrofolate reductase
LGIDILNIKDTPVGSIIIGGPNTWRQYLEADMITRAYVTKIAEDYLGDLQYDLFSEVKKRMDLKPIIYKPDFTVYYGSK